MKGNILIFLFVPLLAFADDNSERVAMWQAKSYLEAGDGAKADAIYNTLLSGESALWKKTILFYDSATAALLMGNNEKAIDLYSQVPLGRNPPAFFIRALRGNMAVARWRLVQKPLREVEEGAASFPDTYFKAGDLLRLIFNDINSAQKADCAMQKGGCVPLPLLEQVRLAAQERLSWLLMKLQEKRMASLTPEEGIPVLFTGIEELDNNLEAIALTKGAPADVLAQCRRVADGADSWLKVWTFMRDKISGSLQYDQAAAAFANVAPAAKAGGVDKARQYLDEARRHLDEVYAYLIAKNPVVESLRRLLSRYDSIRETLTVQEAALDSLAREQKVVLQKISNRDSTEMTKQLEASIAFVHDGNVDAATLFLNIARQEIVRLLWEIEPLRVPLTQHILEMTVEEQRNALALVRISRRMEQLPPGVDEIIGKSQEKVIERADAFYAAALSQQKIDFKEKGRFCQYHPWNEVFPLFFAGDDVAKRALKMIDRVGLSRGEDLKLFQDNALSKFNEALEELKKPKSNESCKASQAPEEGKEEKAQMEQVLRLLQKMEQDDRQQKTKKPSASSAGGTKPW